MFPFGVLIKLKIEDHAYCRPLIKALVERKGVYRYMEYAPDFAITAGIPIFTTYFYIAEIVGFTPQILERMKSISKFYGYTEIIVETELDLKQFVGN